MKKKKKGITKSGFVKGAFITTLGIVITKILGILYVIPFHAIIGEQGGALYGYAYTIYLLFMSLSSAGIPLAISKIVSEYQTLGYYQAKRRAFVLGKRIALLLGFICFVLLSLFAPFIAQFILGDLSGGNTIEDVTFVIWIISTAILIVPLLSIYRGYFEGHRFMSPPSISQVIEQLFRVLVIVLGSYFALRVFHLSLTSAVGVAVFGATAGAIASYLYLVLKKRGNEKKFNEKVRKVNEPIITDKQILRKIILYAVPFIMIDVFKSLYSYVDMLTVINSIVDYSHFDVVDAETVMSMLSTWGAKFNMIILSVSTGVIVSLIPNLTQAVVKKDEKDVHQKINQSFSILFYLTIPMTLGLSFLAEPVWLLFYGKSVYGPSVLTYYIFVGLFVGLFTAIISIVQALKDYKTVFISLFVGIILKCLLTTNLIIAFYKMGVPAYYGAITASIIGYFASLLICLVVLHFKYQINYEDMIKNFIDVLCASMIMIFVLFLIRFIVPISSDTRILNLGIILLYTVCGGCIYFFCTYRMKTVKHVFGDRISKYFQKK